MYRNESVEINSASQVLNYLNRNITNPSQIYENNDGRITNEADIEIVNINSPNYNEQTDSDEHDLALNEAWHCINEARRQRCNPSESAPRNNFHERIYGRQSNNYEHQQQVYRTTYRSDSANNYLHDITEIIEQERSRCFAAINDYLDVLETSSLDDIPNRIEQNYMKNEIGQHDDVNVYDKTIYIQETPTLIYTYKKEDLISEHNNDLICSPKNESSNSAASTTSEDNYLETPIQYDSTFYSDSLSFHPIILPRRPLKYMLPTVIEILEPNRQSAKVTEISYDENVPLKRKTSNSWVKNGKGKSNSDSANNTVEINFDNSRNDSSPIKESAATLNNKVDIRDSNDRIEKEQRVPKDSKLSGTDSVNSKQSIYSKEIKTENSKSSDSRAHLHIFINTFIDDQLEKGNNKFLNSTGDDTICEENFENSIRSKDRHLSSNFTKEYLSVNRGPPFTLLSDEIKPTKKSWSRRFIKCILCCK